MKKTNRVFIAQSLDGYIAGKNGEIDWLEMIPNTENSDLGYPGFMEGVDALVMGRNTFELVCSFGGEWPYQKPLFVLSNSLETIPAAYQDKAELVKGSLREVLETIHQKGFFRLYIDGGVTIQSFLKEDLIDEVIITTLPIILGGGIPLFGTLDKALEFELVKTEIYLKHLVMVHYKRKRQ